MKKLYVARVKTSEYKAKDGSTKANWETIGNIYEGDNGKTFMYLKRYFNPAGIDTVNNDSIVVCLFPEDNKSNTSFKNEINNNNDNNFSSFNDCPFDFPLTPVN